MLKNLFLLIITHRVYYRSAAIYRPIAGLSMAGVGGGGVDARHRRSVDLEGSGSMLFQKLFDKFD